MRLPPVYLQIINTPITTMEQLKVFMTALPNLMANDKSGRITEMVKQTLDNIVHEEVQIARKERLAKEVE
jgi:hypothetical protein